MGVGVGFQCPHVIFKTANRREGQALDGDRR